jgi:hypothetical protein
LNLIKLVKDRLLKAQILLERSLLQTIDLEATPPPTKTR